MALHAGWSRGCLHDDEEDEEEDGRIPTLLAAEELLSCGTEAPSGRCGVDDDDAAADEHDDEEDPLANGPVRSSSLSLLVPGLLSCSTTCRVRQRCGEARGRDER